VSNTSRAWCVRCSGRSRGIGCPGISVKCGELGASSQREMRGAWRIIAHNSCAWTRLDRSCPVPSSFFDWTKNWTTCPVPSTGHGCPVKFLAEIRLDKTGQDVSSRVMGAGRVYCMFYTQTPARVPWWAWVASSILY